MITIMTCALRCICNEDSINPILWFRALIGQAFSELSRIHCWSSFGYEELGTVSFKLQVIAGRTLVVLHGFTVLYNRRYLGSMVACIERVLQDLAKSKTCGSYFFQEQSRTIRLFSRYSIMKSTIIPVAMTLIFSVFSVSARAQDPFTSTIDSHNINCVCISKLFISDHNLLGIFNARTPSDSVRVTTDSTTLNTDFSRSTSSTLIAISVSITSPTDKSPLPRLPPLPLPAKLPFLLPLKFRHQPLHRRHWLLPALLLLYRWLCVLTGLQLVFSQEL